MSLSAKQSFALRAVSLFATLMVVARHGQNLHLYYRGGSPFMTVTDYNIFIQEMISRITDCAIPCFFTISGFLFFIGVDKIQDFFKKWKRRIRSLVIPYLLWNLLLLSAVLLGYAMIPGLRKQLSLTYEVEFHWKWFVEIFTTKPIVGQFWYIRTLIIFCILSPLPWFIYRYSLLSFITLGALIFYWVPIDCRILSSEGMACFFLGGLIWHRQWHKYAVYGKRGWIFPPSVLAIIGVEMLCNTSRWIWILRIFLSMASMVQIALFCGELNRVQIVVNRMSHYSFFIYAAHYMLLGILTIPLSRVLNHSPAMSLSAYLICVVMATTISLFAAIFVDKFFPKLYSVLTGGR